MNQGSMFRTPEEEVVELARELGELKSILRDISRRLAQIEGRARRAFPSSFPKPPATNRGTWTQAAEQTPTLSVEQVLALYAELVQTAKDGNREEVQRRLEGMEPPNLLLLSRELGVSVGKRKPSRVVLINGVLGRLNESLMLSPSSLRQRSGIAPSGPSGKKP